MHTKTWCCLEMFSRVRSMLACLCSYKTIITWLHSEVHDNSTVHLVLWKNESLLLCSFLILLLQSGYLLGGWTAWPSVCQNSESVKPFSLLLSEGNVVSQPRAAEWDCYNTANKTQSFFPCVCLFKGHHCQIGLLVNSCFLNTDQHSQFMQPLIRCSSAQIWRQTTQSLYPDLFCMSYISVKGQTVWECVVWSPFV